LHNDPGYILINGWQKFNHCVNQFHLFSLALHAFTTECYNYTPTISQFEVWNISVTTPTRFRNAYYLFKCCILLHSL